MKKLIALIALVVSAICLTACSDGPEAIAKKFAGSSGNDALQYVAPECQASYKKKLNELGGEELFSSFPSSFYSDRKRYETKENGNTAEVTAWGNSIDGYVIDLKKVNGKWMVTSCAPIGNF